MTPWQVLSKAVTDGLTIATSDYTVTNALTIATSDYTVTDALAIATSDYTVTNALTATTDVCSPGMMMMAHGWLSYPPCF